MLWRTNKVMKDVRFYLVEAKEFAGARSISECSIVLCQGLDVCFHAFKQTLKEIVPLPNPNTMSDNIYIYISLVRSEGSNRITHS